MFKDFKTFIKEEYKPLTDAVQIVDAEDIKKRNFIWVREYGDEAVGSFNHKDTKAKNDYTLLIPDSRVKEILSELNLKKGQFVTRYETETTKIGGMQPLVLVDLNREMVYFLEDSESEEVKFSRKGSKLRYLTVREDFVKKYVK